MSHPSQQKFVAYVASINPALVKGARVLEIGSYDVNGSTRSLFAAAEEYVGVDLVEGPGVDIVGFGHEVDHPDGSFDITISCECLEHDPHWSETLANMARLTRPGGMVLVTCAGRGRLEHGTTRTGPLSSPGTQSIGIDYYHNLTSKEVMARSDFARLFSSWVFPNPPAWLDLYFVAVRAGKADPGATTPVLPGEDALACLGTAGPTLPRRVAYFPLRAASKLLSDRAYQETLIPLRRVRWAVQRRFSENR